MSLQASLSPPPQTSGGKGSGHNTVSPRSAAGSDGTPRDVNWDTPRELSESELAQLGLGADRAAKGGTQPASTPGVKEDGEQIFFSGGAPVSEEEEAFFTMVETVLSKARNNRYEEVEQALQNSFAVDSKDHHGNTLLMVCAQNGLKRMAKLVLRHGAEMNARNNKGQTALHYCFTYGYHALGEYLISKGCDPSIRNHDGLTCYDGIRRGSADAGRPLSAGTA